MSNSHAQVPEPENPSDELTSDAAAQSGPDAQKGTPLGAQANAVGGSGLDAPSDRLLKLAPDVDVWRLVEIALTNPRLTANEQIALIDEIRKMSGIDRWTFRYAILGLGLISAFAIGAMVYLSTTGGGKELSSGILAIGSTAVGGIAGLLSQGRESKG